MIPPFSFRSLFLVLNASSPVCSLLPLAQDLGFLVAMVLLVSEYKLCINDQVVPVEEKSFTFVDPYDLVSETQNLDLEERRDLKVMSFKGRSDLGWCDRALKLPARTLIRNLNDLPLINEIKDLIRNIKKANQKGPKARQATEWKSLVLLKVRDRLLLCQNTTHSVVVALVGPDGDPEDQEGEARTLEWFMNQMQEDLKTLKGPARSSQQSSSSQVPAKADEVHERANEVLQLLRQHPACSKAFWCPSRTGFQVLKKGTQIIQEFRVQGLNKRKKAQGPEDTEEPFEKTQSGILEYLDAQEEVPEQAPSASAEDLKDTQVSQDEDSS